MIGFLPLLFAIGDALARAGGGHGYSGGGSSSGGSSSGGGGGGDITGLLFWLLLEHPAVGIPVILIVVAVSIVSQRQRAQGGGRQVVRGETRGATAPARRRAQDLGWLLRLDPTFSAPLFADLSRLLYVRIHEERGRDKLEVLQAFVAPEVRTALRARNPNATEVRDVILGTSALVSAGQDGKAAGLTVMFEANYTEVTGTKLQQWLVRERWTFARALTAQSPGPEKMRELRCPSCGSALETRTNGTCRNCDTLIDDGRLQWRVVEAKLLESTPLPPIQLQPGSGVEEGTNSPVVLQADLAARMRELGARHPEFSLAEFQQRVTSTFERIQEAWGAGAYDRARPYETDFLYQQHRYWIERYAREGLRNKLADVRVTQIVPVRVTMDAFVETITVRIFARMKDWTENREGRVLGGSKSGDRIFSEYWTFQRSAILKAGKPGSLEQCPSCGAPLDNVSAAGVCGYCESKIASGDYDWVVSAIDQDEAYLG
jgi:predicted lipid-binding transport protein (Tim44 family)/ribosomal protein L37AE/L43A